MENDLLIDLAESTGDCVNTSSGTLDATAHLESFLGGSGVSVSMTGVVFPASNARENLLKRSNSTLLSPFKCSMNNKTSSVESLSSFNPDYNGFSATDGKMKGRAQSLTFGVLNAKDSSEILSPFGCSKPRNASSLQSVSLLDSDPSKVLSPFGFLVSWDEKRSKNVQTNEVPVGDLLDVEEEPELPDDMFDIEVLEKKQAERPPPPSLNVATSSTASYASGDGSSNGTMNRGFLDTGSGGDDVFAALDDSVFEEALVLAKEFSKMEVEGAYVEGIESEDEGIVYECPDWNDENVAKESASSEGREDIKRLLELYSREKSLDEDVANQDMVNGNELNSNSRLALNSVIMTPNKSKSEESSFNSSTCSISPVPLSTNAVDLMRLKAGKSVGSKLGADPMKLWTSSSTAPVRNVPLKALIPMDQIIRKKSSSSFTPNSGKKSICTPNLRVTLPSPTGKSEENDIQIMASTPKPNHTKCASYMKKRQSDVMPGNNRGKQSPGSFLTPSIPTMHRSSSSGKMQELKKNAMMNGTKRVMIPSPIPRKKFLNGPVQPSYGAAKNPSPVVRRKLSHNPSPIRTPIRSSSTGCLPNTGSGSVISSTRQLGALQSQGRSSSVSTKMHLNGRPLADACVNSPAKASSPLRKLMSKFRRSMPSRGMKENVSPV